MSKTPFIVNLDRICKSKGLSITKMLKEMGWSTSKVTLWNNGSLPKMDTIEKIAEYLGVPVSEFFIDPDAPFPGDPQEILNAKRVAESYGVSTPKEELSEDEQDIIAIFRACTRREQHEIMAMMYKYEKEAE